jgi:hypothetical protein
VKIPEHCTIDKSSCIILSIPSTLKSFTLLKGHSHRF